MLLFAWARNRSDSSAPSCSRGRARAADFGLGRWCDVAHRPSSTGECGSLREGLDQKEQADPRPLRHFLYVKCLVRRLLARLVMMASLAGPRTVFFYRSRALVVVVCVIAAFWALQGLENVGVVDFRSPMDFPQEFMFPVGGPPERGSSLSPVALCVRTAHYWSLLPGMMFGLLTVALSELIGMSPYRRPRLSLARTVSFFGSRAAAGRQHPATRGDALRPTSRGRVRARPVWGLSRRSQNTTWRATRRPNGGLSTARHVRGYDARCATRPSELGGRRRIVIGMIAASPFSPWPWS